MEDWRFLVVVERDDDLSIRFAFQKLGRPEMPTNAIPDSTATKLIDVTRRRGNALGKGGKPKIHLLASLQCRASVFRLQSSVR